MADHSARLTGDEAAELRRILGGRPHVLVAARGGSALVALLSDRMAIRTAQGWQLVAWPDIQRGGWDSENLRLHWELVDGTSDEVTLDHPGQLPHAFAERVRASIAVTRHVTLENGLGVVQLVGRRRPGSQDPVTWHAESVGRCDLGDPRVQTQVMDLVEQLRAEFE